MEICGLILAGGTGSRLWPLTKSVNKHLLPVHDKPMIYYPLSNLMLAGVRDIAIVTDPKDVASFENLLGDGSLFGISISYISQAKPIGVADGLRESLAFIQRRKCLVHLGDNFFFGAGMISGVVEALANTPGSTVFTYKVPNPKAFAVLSHDEDGSTYIEEKPENPKSENAVTGLYVFDESLERRTSEISKGERGEFEIVPLLQSYLVERRLQERQIPRGVAWLDLGTLQDLNHAASFVSAVQFRQATPVGSPEEIALTRGWIDKKGFTSNALNYPQSEYSRLLKQVMKV